MRGCIVGGPSTIDGVFVCGSCTVRRRRGEAMCSSGPGLWLSRGVALCLGICLCPLHACSMLRALYLSSEPTDTDTDTDTHPGSFCSSHSANLVAVNLRLGRAHPRLSTFVGTRPPPRGIPEAPKPIKQADPRRAPTLPRIRRQPRRAAEGLPGGIFMSHGRSAPVPPAERSRRRLGPGPRP